MKSPNDIQLQYYNDQDNDYEKDSGFLARGLTRAYRRKAHIIFKHIEDLKPLKILEIGAGSGLMTFFLSQLYGGELVALDLSEEMLKIAQSRITKEGVSFVVGDAAALNFSDDMFDVVVGVDIIHHLENPCLAMEEWRRVTRPEGRMVFLETNAYNPLNLRNIGLEHEVRSFLNTDKNLKLWAQKAGWNLVVAEPAPSYTPSGPRWMEALLDVVDITSTKIPIWNRLAALWLLKATKTSC